MLGHFVDSIFLGYYRAAFVLISSFSALLPFSGVLLPIFTQIGGKRLKRGVQKSFKYLIIVAIPLTIGLMILSKYIIFLLYGKEYLPASVPLLFLSLLIIVTPLIALYSAIFQAKEKPMFLAKFAIISLLINIVLNYILIKTLLSISQQYAIIGAAIATLISNIFLLAVLMIKTNSYFKIRPSIKMILKSIFATAIMSAFLLVFMKFVNINLFSGALMVILGIIIYFFVIFLIKGLGKEDIDTFKLIIKKEEQ
jgi:O-antigen/teichoic acid export membrane protein